MKFSLIFLTYIMLSASFNLASAESVKRYTTAGKPVEVGKFWRIDKCKTWPTKIKIIKRPVNGSLKTQSWTHKIKPRDKDYKNCGGISVRGIQLIYTSKRNFRGTDRFQYRRYDNRPTRPVNRTYSATVNVK